MNPAWIPAISGGVDFAKSLLDRTTTTEGRLSPELVEYLRSLYKKLDQPLPYHLMRPITQHFGREEERLREEAVEGVGMGSGLLSTDLRRLTAAKGGVLGRVGEQYRSSIEDQIGQILGRTGQQVTTAPLDISASLEDIGWALFMATQGKKKPGGQAQAPYGGGLQYSPGFLGG